MIPAPGLAAYLALAGRAEGYARRKLAERLTRGKEHPERHPERLGIASQPRPGGRLVWFHAASVGEALSLLELLRRLVEAEPGVTVLLTTGTVTSAEVREGRLPSGCIHQFAPLDARAAVRRFLDHWQPDLAVWTESEFWPALMWETGRRKVPMLLVNARMSRRAHRGWRWIPGTAGALLRMFDRVLAQDEDTARRLRRLGVPRWRLAVAGTLKEGAAALPCNEAERSALALLLGRRPVWLAASTHEGEEALALRAHRQAARSAQRLMLILAPRHPDRGDAVEALIRAEGLRLRRRSRGERPEDDTEVFLADTLGEMGLWYRLAPVSFLGGSLVAVGGHNPFEPAALGSAILHGPHVENFADIYGRLAAAGATVVVADGAALAQALPEVLAADRAAAMAHAAWETASSGAEVTDRTLETIRAALADARAG